LAPTRRKLFKVAQWIFAALVLFFAARSLATQWTRVQPRLSHIQFGWQWIGVATVLVLLTYALLIEGWRRVLGAWDSHLPFPQAARIWFLSNLGKYVPGNIWSLTAMGVMARERGLSALAAAGS
jgi:glycosyltransferase 2 family protein